MLGIEVRVAGLNCLIIVWVDPSWRVWVLWTLELLCWWGSPIVLMLIDVKVLRWWLIVCWSRRGARIGLDWVLSLASWVLCWDVVIRSDVAVISCFECIMDSKTFIRTVQFGMMKVTVALLA